MDYQVVGTGNVLYVYSTNGVNAGWIDAVSDIIDDKASDHLDLVYTEFLVSGVGNYPAFVLIFA